MIKFYYNNAPNPMKVALLLEELGVPYEAVPVDSRKGEQHAPAFLAINPNGKLPAITDEGGANVFDSNAILLYLADKHGKFLPPAGDKNRADLLSWLMFVASGIGPYTGQYVHFSRMAAEKSAYAEKRYGFEANRHWDLIEARLAHDGFMVGGAYTILDMAVWGWSTMIPFALGDETYARFPNIKKHWDMISARPAAERVRALRGKHAFKAEMDDEARRHLFPHLAA